MIIVMRIHLHNNDLDFLKILFVFEEAQLKTLLSAEVKVHDYRHKIDCEKYKGWVDLKCSRDALSLA